MERKKQDERQVGSIVFRSHGAGRKQRAMQTQRHVQDKGSSHRQITFTNMEKERTNIERGARLTRVLRLVGRTPP